jgi:3-methyladenine DNA glycosylase AlkD
MKKRSDQSGSITASVATDVQNELRALADPGQVRHLSRFFKTGPGEYGEGDRFLGIRVPAQRTIARKYRNLPLDEVAELVRSEFHEERLTGLLILTYRFPKATTEEKQAIYEFYIAHIPWINNWDLVDVTAPNIVGTWLEKRQRDILYVWAGSANIWERRLAILSTLHFIRQDDFSDTVRLANLLMHDTHDLIHKAVGWMLRETGKRNLETLLLFLEEHSPHMPRTMLRYAIERLPEEQRREYLNRGR